MTHPFPSTACGPPAPKTCLGVSAHGLSRVRNAAPRLVVGVLALLGLLVGTSGCGFDAQTLKPYTPGMGVNADVGPDAALKVRNLLLVSRVPGQGFVSASLISTRPDALVGVSGVAITAEGTEGAPLEATVTDPVTLEPHNLIVLTERPLIQVRSPDLVAGTAARVLLKFREAGEVTVLVPIYRNQDELETIRPSWPASADKYLQRSHAPEMAD